MEPDPATDKTAFRDRVGAVAPWVGGTGILLVVAAGLFTAGGAPEILRPLALAAMACGLGSLAGAAVHRSPGFRPVLAIVGVLVLALGSTFFGMSYSG